MSASGSPPHTPPTEDLGSNGGSTIGTRSINERLFALAQDLRDTRNLIRRQTGEPELGPLLEPAPGSSAREPNIESLRSNGGSRISTRNINEEIDNVIRVLREGRAMLQARLDPPQEPDEPNEPNEPSEPEELIDFEELDEPEEAEQEGEPIEPGEGSLPPLDPIDSQFYAINFVQGPAPVSVLDLPVEDRICCICRLDFLHSVNDSETEIHARMDSLNIDEHSQGLCVPIRLRCGHIVGDKCILAWVNHNLRRGLNGTCPICRTIIRRLPMTSLDRFLEGFEG